MKRDMDTIRRIALETSALPFGQSLIGVDCVSDEDFSMHAIWMEEAGLVKASITEFFSGEAPKVLVHRLTWQGCEFADAIKDDTMWSKAKREVIAPATSFTFEALKEWLKAEITQGFPTIRDL